MRLTNQRKMKAMLTKIVQTTDEDDRPTVIRKKVREIYYRGLGVYASEKYLSVQAKTEVQKRIGIRQDNDLDEKNFGIQIKGVDYNIIRIYVNEAQKEMELSLSLVQ